MTLKSAVAIWQRQVGADRNSYDWYRRSAHLRGQVTFGGSALSVWKNGKGWWVADSDVASAMQTHSDDRAQLAQNTFDVRRGIVHGKDGDVVALEGGGYQVRGSFRFVWNDQARILKESHGCWFCNACNAVAKTRHDKPECHRCRDWNSCGQDCTLSEIYCETCGVRLSV
jgi:hypothetical protein